MVGFADSFWDREPNGTVGYDSLVKRLKDGKKMCDDFSEFLRLRAKAEDDYGKGLVRLAQQAGGNEEIGTLKDAWDMMKKETESVGMAHCEVAKKIEDLDRRVKVFRDDQKTERAKIDEKIKKLQREKRIAYENVLKCKRQYEQKCKELDAATGVLDSIAIYTPKEEEKHRAKKLKAKTNQENADQQYQSAVKTLEQIHDIWETEMEVGCDRYQKLEEERIKFFRNEMWLYSNIGSQINVDEDKMYENIRMQLEKCDESKDTTFFVHSKQTGSERPARLKYENYYHPQKATVTASELAKPKHFSIGRHPAAGKPVGLASPIPSGNITSQVFIEDNDADYASIDQIQAETAAKRKSPTMLRASYDYNPQGPEELFLKKGDIIQMINYENEEWGKGWNQRTGEDGVFPLAFVQKVQHHS